MVLASTSETEDLEALASLADIVAEAATPTVSAIETSYLLAEVEQLRTEIADFKSLVKSLSSHSLLLLLLNVDSLLDDGHLVLLRLLAQLVCVCTTCVLQRRQPSAISLVLGTPDTNRPVTNGDQCPPRPTL